MGQFMDKDGLKWNVDIVLSTLRRVRSFAQIDLTDPVVVTTIGEDVFTFGSVMYAICEPQVLERGLTEEQFAAVFDGDAVESAVTCLIEGLIAFTRPAQRPALERAMAKRKEMVAKTVQAQIAVFDGTLMDESLENEIEKTTTELRSRFGKPSTSLPESSESTPDP